MCRRIAARSYDVLQVPPPPRTTRWQKSSASGESQCVEVARNDDYVWIRDSKNRDGSALGFTRKEWLAFLEGVRRGEFDCPAQT
jgi:hypothetical protein